MESPNLTIRPEDKTIESQAVQAQSKVMGGSTVEIKSCERIDDLQCKGYQIIQNSGMFCFGMDAVLLANYVRFKRGGRYLDLGTGTGIIPILLAAKEYGEEALTREERLAGLYADDCRFPRDCIAVDGVTNSDAGDSAIKRQIGRWRTFYRYRAPACMRGHGGKEREPQWA